jgi:hypothetical protein
MFDDDFDDGEDENTFQLDREVRTATCRLVDLGHGALRPRLRPRDETVAVPV